MRDPETRRLTPDERASEVRDAFARIAAGEPVVAVSRLLGMTPGGLRYLIRNRVYLGELRVGDYTNTEAHPAIVDGELFAAANRAIERAPRPPRRGHAPALLAGLVRCTACGHVMTRSWGKQWPGYKCVVNHSGDRCPEPAYIGCARLDAYVEELAEAELARLEVEAFSGGGVRELRASLGEAERKQAAFLDAVEVEDVGVEAYRRTAQRHRDAVDAAARAVAEAEARAPLAGVGDAYGTLGVQERNTLLRSLLAAVVVRRAGGTVTPVGERVRVLRWGTPLPDVGPGKPGGLAPIPFPDADAEGVIAAPRIEDRFEGAGGVD